MKQQNRPLSELLEIKSSRELEFLNTKEQETFSNYFSKQIPYSCYFRDTVDLILWRYKYKYLRRKFVYYNFFVYSSLVNNSYNSDENKEKVYLDLFDKFETYYSNSDDKLFKTKYLNPFYIRDDIYSLMLGKDSFIYVLADSNNEPIFFFNGILSIIPPSNFGLDDDMDIMLSEIMKYDSDYRDIVVDPDEYLNNAYKEECISLASYFFTDTFVDKTNKNFYRLNNDYFDWCWKLNPLDILKLSTNLSKQVSKRKLDIKVTKIYPKDVENYNLYTFANAVNKLKDDTSKSKKYKKRNPKDEYTHYRDLAKLYYSCFLKRYFNTLELFDTLYNQYLIKKKNKKINNDMSSYIIDFDKYRNIEN